MTTFFAIYNVDEQQSERIVHAVELGLQRCRSIYRENGTEEDHTWVFAEGAGLLKVLAISRRPATSLDAMNVLRLLYIRGARDVAIAAAGYCDDVRKLWAAMVVDAVTITPNQVDWDQIPLTAKEIERERHQRGELHGDRPDHT